MSNILTAIGLISIVLFNLFVFRISNVFVLVSIGTIVYALGCVIQTPRITLKRFALFLYIGITIGTFRILFNQENTPFIPIQQTARTVLQIAIISEAIFLALKRISLVRLMGALWFLPRSIQLFFAMTFSFIPLLLAEQETIRIVQLSRGGGCTALSRLYMPVALLIPLLHRIMQRSEVLAYSMISRGFVE